MPQLEILNAAEVAEILGTSTQAIRNAVHRGMEGESVPPSIKLGAKRCWRRKDVYEWLDQKPIATCMPKPVRLGRRRKSTTGSLRNDLNQKSHPKKRRKT